MKKLFVICPVEGRTLENIKKSMQKLHKIAEAVFEEELEVINSDFREIPVPDSVKSLVTYDMGINLIDLSKADYCIYVPAWLIPIAKKLDSDNIDLLHIAVRYNEHIKKFEVGDLSLIVMDDFVEYVGEDKQCNRNIVADYRSTE